MIRRSHVAIIALACLVPRLLALVAVRGGILDDFTEKSDTFARVFVSSGTFGLIPGVPSAYTQPLYSFVLIPLYWVERSWWLIGTTQALIAFLTALVVYLIGLRIGDARVALTAALVSTLNPYLVWHDIHVNREILDQLAGALLVLATLACATRPTKRRGLLLGVVTGVAVLGNSRLALLPIVLGAYLIVLRRREAVLPFAAILAGVAIAIVPWGLRNAERVGCFTITTDARALWKANNPATLETLRGGDWIDQVPDLAGIPLSPQDAADRYASNGEIVVVDECAQMRFYQREVLRFWRDHPGEKAQLAAFAVRSFWSPLVGPASQRSEGSDTWLDTARNWVVPTWVVALLAFAVIGARRVPRYILGLILTLLAYETLMAGVFTGATRYRMAWEFLLALLAAPAIVSLLDRVGSRNR